MFGIHYSISANHIVSHKFDFYINILIIYNTPSGPNYGFWKLVLILIIRQHSIFCQFLPKVTLFYYLKCVWFLVSICMWMCSSRHIFYVLCLLISITCIAYSLIFHLYSLALHQQIKNITKHRAVEHEEEVYTWYTGRFSGLYLPLGDTYEATIDQAISISQGEKYTWFHCTVTPTMPRQTMYSTAISEIDDEMI